MDALRLPARRRATSTKLSGGERRRVALCRLLLSAARPAAPRRAHEPPRRRVGRLARAPPRTSTRARSSRSRTTATSSTTSPAGSSSSTAARASRARATTRRGSSRRRRGSASRRSRSRRAAAHARSASSSGCACARRARHAKSKARLAALREAARARSRATERRPVEIYIPPGPRLGDVVVEAENCSKGFGDRLLIEDLTFDLPPGGIVGVIGPNGAGKTTLFRMIAGQEKPDAGTLERRRDGQARVRRPEPRRARRRRRRSRRRSRAAATTIELGKREVNSRAYVAWFNFRGADQQKQVGDLSGRRAQPRAPREAAASRAATSCSSTSRRTTSTSRPCARSRRRSLDFAGCAVVISTTAGSSTASPRTSWRSRATPR